MRKLLVLLLLPIVAFTSMGAAAFDAAAAPAQTAVVTVEAAAEVAPTRLDDLCAYSHCMSPEERDAAYGASLYLPVNRWTNMDYHSRVNWWSPVEAGNASTSRFAAGIMMSAGNNLWKTSSDWSRGAMQFNPFDSALGFQVDKIAGVLGNAITGQPILFALIVTFLLVVLLWRALRRPGTRPFGKLIQAAIVFSLITMMSTQAAAATAGNVTPTYKPKAGSPVWIANSVTGTIDNMASLAVTGVMDGMLPVLTSSLGAGSPTGWSCTAMIDSSFKAAGQSQPTAGAQAVGRAMNSMWIATAYNTYATVQFGDGNPYAKEVACRQLERLTSADQHTRAQMLSYSLYGRSGKVGLKDASGTPFDSIESPMLLVTGDTEANDAALIAWAACQPNNAAGTSFTVRTGWKVKKDGSPWITAADCAEAFAAKDADAIKNAGDGVFNIADANAAREITNDDAVINYINTLQGKDMGVAIGSTTSSVVFLIGAFISAGIFGIMALAVIASKIFMLLLVAGMFLILVISLFKNDSMSETMQKPMYRFLGVTIFAFGSTLLLAILATFSLVTSSLSTLLGPAGSIGSIMWVSASPIIAVIAVHFLFTKMFKMPSPVTAKGALAWGTAGGAVGGAVGASMVNRMQNSGARLAKNAGRSVMSKNRVGRFLLGEGGAGGPRKGAGDAGARDGRQLGGDITSEDARQRLAAERGGVGDPEAMQDAAAENAGAEIGGLSKATQARIEREAKEELRQLRRAEKDAARQERMGLGAKLAARNDSKAALLAEHVAENGGDDSLLSEKARGKVSLVNRDPMGDGFELQEPGTNPEAAAPLAPAKWKDLSKEGRVEAAKLAAAARQKARDEVRTARKQARSDAWSGAKASMTAAGVNAASGVKALGTADGWKAAGSAAWTGVKSSPAAARATMDAARNATRATSDAARNATRKAAEATRTDQARKIARTSAVVAGVGVSVFAAPVGAAMIAGAAVSKRRESKPARQEEKLRKQAQLNEIIAAKARAHRAQRAPSTSTVSDAAPVTQKNRR